MRQRIVLCDREKVDSVSSDDEPFARFEMIAEWDTDETGVEQRNDQAASPTLLVEIADIGTHLDPEN